MNLDRVEPVTPWGHTKWQLNRGGPLVYLLSGYRIVDFGTSPIGWHREDGLPDLVVRAAAWSGSVVEAGDQVWRVTGPKLLCRGGCNSLFSNASQFRKPSVL